MEKYLDLRNKKDYKKLKEAAQVIKSGGTVILPTETVYGIGANGLDEEAVKKIYEAKGRNEKNPINLLVSDMEMVESVAKNISELEYKLMEKFFPGPFTIVLEKKEIVPSIVTSNLETVGVRMPSGEIARKLVEYAGVPIAAPSANVSGKPSGTNVDDIINEFANKVDYIINGGESQIGIESTIVKVIDDVVHILRPGFITPEQIKEVADVVVIDNKLSPSNNFGHYKPKSKCILIYSDDNKKMVDEINKLAKEHEKPLIIAATENINLYNLENKIDMGSRNNLEEISKNIFNILRKVDTYEADIIIIEGVDKQGLGLAIMNRLANACNNNYKEIYK